MLILAGHAAIGMANPPFHFGIKLLQNVSITNHKFELNEVYGFENHFLAYNMGIGANYSFPVNSNIYFSSGIELMSKTIGLNQSLKDGLSEYNYKLQLNTLTIFIPLELNILIFQKNKPFYRSFINLGSGINTYHFISVSDGSNSKEGIQSVGKTSLIKIPPFNKNFFSPDLHIGVKNLTKLFNNHFFEFGINFHYNVLKSPEIQIETRLDNLMNYRKTKPRISYLEFSISYLLNMKKHSFV